MEHNCPKCKGTGKLSYPGSNPILKDMEPTISCPKCKGTGKITQMFTKKQIEGMGSAIASIHDKGDRMNICEQFITILMLDNPKFDHRNFRKLCKYNPITVAPSLGGCREDSK